MRLLTVPGTFTSYVSMYNKHPVPGGLPSGLDTFHLFRRARDVMSLNRAVPGLASLADAGLLTEAIAGGEGTLTYTDTYVRSDRRRAGWTDDDRSLNYTDGYTVMTVARFTSSSSQHPASFGTQDYSSSTGTGERLNLSNDQASFRGQRRIDDTSTLFVATHSFGATVTLPVLAFGQIDVGDEEIRCYAPHTAGSVVAEALTDLDQWDPNATPGIGWGRAFTSDGSAEASATQVFDMYLGAIWQRVLSKSEMDAAYDLIKPWLLGLGVTIA